ncbi:uncharacterized protein BJ212DRAFT_1482856 [Suillus subaureus]|uniref:Uncharacterized protein n=1 Tax=Suillus subaureus TaxID=48587 RepID=A0A9P7JBG1_9AGAM|nr:uncharacterized protein BJ212DRAFT_1482856 [Suillus subaureus]KAG1812785.1 hypothetical protein BJ212DRAFT_1482856 [Suillus subaureus]
MAQDDKLFSSTGNEIFGSGDQNPSAPGDEPFGPGDQNSFSPGDQNPSTPGDELFAPAHNDLHAPSNLPAPGDNEVFTSTDDEPFGPGDNELFPPAHDNHPPACDNHPPTPNDPPAPNNLPACDIPPADNEIQIDIGPRMRPNIDIDQLIWSAALPKMQETMEFVHLLRNASLEDLIAKLGEDVPDTLNTVLIPTLYTFDAVFIMFSQFYFIFSLLSVVC